VRTGLPPARVMGGEPAVAEHLDGEAQARAPGPLPQNRSPYENIRSVSEFASR
jgi:hypothetical protein